MKKTTWNKNIVMFLASQTISLFGSALVQYAITWYITLQTKSGVMMTIAIISGFLPTLLISPFAGVWADRYNRKVLIALADSLIAICTLILAALFFFGIDSMWLLFVASSVRSLGTGIQSPSVNAFIPQLVPEENLTKVNGINGSIQSVVSLASPLLSAALLTITSIEFIFLIDVITALIAVIILVSFLHVPAHVKTLDKQDVSYLGDVKEGIKYILNHEYVMTIFTFCSIYFVTVTPLAFLTPLQVTLNYGESVWRLTAIEIAFSLGMIAGGLFIANWKGFKNKLYTMVLSNLIISICTILLGFTRIFSIYLMLMALVGIAMPLFNTPFIVLLQKKVEGNYSGRVFGVLSMILDPLNYLYLQYL